MHDHQSLHEIALTNLRHVEVLASHGIMIHPERRLTLVEACRELDLDPGLVGRDLCAVPVEADDDCAAMSAEELTAYLGRYYHLPLRGALPVLRCLIEEEAQEAPGPAIENLERGFRLMQMDLEAHLTQEEGLLFPAVRRTHLTVPNAALQMMQVEHDEVTAMLELLRGHARELEELPRSHRRKLVIVGLRSLDREMQRHIYLEDEVLFPAIQQLWQLRAKTA